MARDYMKRINALRENYMSHRVEMDILDAYYVTQGFKETEGQPWQIQKATGMKKVYENKPIFIQDNELLVGGVAFKPRAGILNPDSACSVIEKELDTISTRKYDPFYLSDENKKLFMEEVAPYWRGKCVLDRWNAMMPEDVRTMRDGGMLYVDKKFVRGYGENTPGWRTLLAKGIKGIKEEAQEKLTYLKNHPAPQFYHVFRPLLDISAKNPTRIKLAQKAILINMAQHKESWDQATARFVQEQRDFARSEYSCSFEKDCSENQKGNLRMAYYIHTAAPKNVKVGTLPCEISNVSGCRNFTN